MNIRVGCTRLGGGVHRRFSEFLKKAPNSSFGPPKDAEFSEFLSSLSRFDRSGLAPGQILDPESSARLRSIVSGAPKASTLLRIDRMSEEFCIADSALRAEIGRKIDSQFSVDCAKTRRAILEHKILRNLDLHEKHSLAAFGVASIGGGLETAVRAADHSRLTCPEHKPSAEEVSSGLEEALSSDLGESLAVPVVLLREAAILARRSRVQLPPRCFERLAAKVAGRNQQELISNLQLIRELVKFRDFNVSQFRKLFEDSLARLYESSNFNVGVSSLTIDIYDCVERALSDYHSTQMFRVANETKMLLPRLMTFLQRSAAILPEVSDLEELLLLVEQILSTTALADVEQSEFASSLLGPVLEEKVLRNIDVEDLKKLASFKIREDLDTKVLEALRDIQEDELC